MYLSQRRIKEKFKYCIGNSFLAETSMEKYLGIYVTDSLSWKEHVSSVKKDCYSRLGVIKRVFGKCSKSVKAKLYTQLVLPKLDYCTTVWNPGTAGLQKILEKIQRRACRVVLGHDIINYTSELAKLNWRPLHERRKINDLIMLYKIFHKVIDVNFDDFLDLRRSRALRTTHSKQIILKKVCTKLYFNSFFHRTISAWNNLPDNIVNQPSLSSFKNSIKKHYGTFNHSNCNICSYL